MSLTSYRAAPPCNKVKIWKLVLYNARRFKPRIRQLPDYEPDELLRQLPDFTLQ